MLTHLERIRLNDGSPADIYLLEAPDDSPLCGALKQLYMNKNDASRRSIFSRLDGKYASVSRDRYFLAVIAENIAGALWYGYGVDTDGIANFGHVYTSPEFRGLGTAGKLLEYFRQDIISSGVQAAFCTCSREWIANMYRKIGFVNVEPGSAPGQLMLPVRTSCRDFKAFAAEYYRSAGNCTPVPGTMAHRHGIDCTGYFSNSFRRRVFPGILTAGNFQQALFLQEDELANISVWQDENASSRGWSMTAALSATMDVFDFSCHDTIDDRQLEKLIFLSLEQQKRTAPLITGLAESEYRYAALLQKLGFTPCGELPGIRLFRRG